jgi:uncharacterized protein with ParB-like and HNH nuclease domain
VKIESVDQEIRNLLSSGYYRIPRFQRPFSWTQENIQEFWDDVVRDNPTDYFIGSMVVFKEGSQRFGVVDGQQRLTTITVLLAVLRNALQEFGFSDLAQGIQGLIERRNIDNQPEFILSTETSYPFFQDHILKFGKPEVSVKEMKEEENLRNAHDQLKELVYSKIQSIKTDTALPERMQSQTIKESLIKMRDALLDLKVIFVKLDDEDDAYIIFETLNTRGKNLSLTDLVKNHITKHLKSQSASVDQTKVKWETVLETIEGSSLDLRTDSFIHHFWLSRYDYLPSKTLFKTLRKKIQKDNAKQFLDDMVSDAAIYRYMHEADYRKWENHERRIKEALTALQLFRVTQQVPCVMSLIRAYNQGKLKKNHLEDTLIAIEKFHFLFTAITSQRSSGGISGMYARLGRSVFEALEMNSAVKVTSELKTMLRKRVPSLEEFKALFSEILYTDRITKARGLVKYILTAFHKETEKTQTVDYSAMTIEHLVPQSRIGKDGFTEQVVGQLGNLILVSAPANDKLANKPFVDKKKILADARFPLPADIAAADVWGIDQILSRTEAMAAEAYGKHWKI